MLKIKIGIIREGKVPTDKRTPLTPRNCIELLEKYPQLEIVVQPSKIRVILDEEYKSVGIKLQEDLSDCAYVFGIKEVPVSDIIEGMQYFFFSHTIKKQPSNRKLLQEIIKKKCTLIDYECLKDQYRNRIISFGHYAGLVGAYNTVKTYGQRYRLFDLKPAHLCFDYAEMRGYFKKVKLKPVKIIVTGGGRVAGGAIQVLEQMRIKQVEPEHFLERDYNHPVFCVLHSNHIYKRLSDGLFDREEFYYYPERYASDFYTYARVADIFMACAFWNPSAPKLFTKQQMRSSDFKIRVIGDITCDIDGSIPSTLRSSSIDNPVYDYNPYSEDLEVPYANERNITTMAIDNLPCELARDASEDFGRQLIVKIFPLILGKDPQLTIEHAKIVSEGILTPSYTYLWDYVKG